MADLPLFWQTITTVLIIVGLIYLLALGIGVYGAEDEQEHEVIWDNDLEEGSAPVPPWWFWSGIAAAFFAVMYMVFYPSFGNYNGLFNSTNTKRYIESKINTDDKYFKKLAVLKQSDIATLQANPKAMHLANNIFVQNCAACHGDDASGQGEFPNLIDKDWAWGNETAQITHSIASGRKATMIAWGAVLGDEGVDSIANYVKSMSEHTYDETKHATGRIKYQQFCIACHGVDLKGNSIFGAPNLVDNVWLYGGDLVAIKQSIAFGRNGVMPAHKDRLSPLQIKLLVAWLQRN